MRAYQSLSVSRHPHSPHRPRLYESPTTVGTVTALPCLTYPIDGQGLVSAWWLPFSTPTQTHTRTMQNVSLEIAPDITHNGANVRIDCHTHRKATKATEIAAYCGEIRHVQRDTDDITLWVYVDRGDPKFGFLIDNLSA